jgi:hypothetical protein
VVPDSAEADGFIEAVERGHPDLSSLAGAVARWWM